MTSNLDELPVPLSEGMPCRARPGPMVEFRTQIPRPAAWPP